MGASITKVLCYLTMNVVLYWQIARSHPIQYDWKRTVLSFSALLLLILIVIQIGLDEPILSFTLRIGSSLFIWTMFVLFMKGILTNHERKTIFLNLAKSKKRFFSMI